MNTSTVNTNYDFGSTHGTTNTSSSIQTGATGATSASVSTWSPSVSSSTETMDLSFATAEVEQESKSFAEGVGEFFGNVWEGIKDTGANIVNGFTQAIDGLKEIGGKLLEGVSTLASNVQTLAQQCKTWLKETAAPWCKKAISAVGDGIAWVWDQILSVGASIVNSIMGLLEGVFELIEGILDAAVAIVGAALSIFTGIGDLFLWLGSLITGNEFESITAAMWKNGIMPIMGYDISGNLFDAIYSTPLFEAIDEQAYGWFKKDSGFYKVMKNVGYVTGTIILGILTGGSSIPLTASTATTIIAGAAKAGSEYEKQYNAITDNGANEVSGADVLRILGNGTGKGIIEGGMWYLTYGSGLQNLTGKFMSGGADAAKSWLAKTLLEPGTFSQALSKFTGKGITTLLTKVFPNTINTGTMIKMGLQFIKPYMNLGVDAGTGLTKAQLGDATWGEVFMDTGVDAVTNALITGLYDMSILKNLMENASAKEASKFGGKNDYYIEGQTTPAADEAIAGMNAAAGKPQIFKNLTKAIGGYDYRGTTGSEYNAAHFTRMWFEGLKKSNGNVAKKTISLPLKALVEEIGDFFGGLFAGKTATSSVSKAIVEGALEGIN